MVKIFLSVRNRLSITKKCIEALKRHSTLPHQIYVYNNQTSYRLDEHFAYFYELYKDGVISQLTFTSDESNFNAFSKASTCNVFGLQHEQDPHKNSYNFLLFLDNDIIVTPDWDRKLQVAWNHVKKHGFNHIKIIGQLPGGIKGPIEVVKIGKMEGKLGTLGGSGLWSVRNNFFTDVGFLPLKELIGHDKRHDQIYWRLLGKSTLHEKKKQYILGLNEKLGIHCGRLAGSVCNVLTRRKNDSNRLEKIKFEESEKNIDKITFGAFFQNIKENKVLMNDW
jgi:hypothetical protein